MTNLRPRETLLLSAFAGDHEEIHRRLREGLSPDFQASEAAGGCSLLQAATQNGHDETIRLLLKFGADVGITNAQGKTALELGVEYDQASAVQLLVER
eukprot:9311682-Prorocentrum_lima.AAC.1